MTTITTSVVLFVIMNSYNNNHIKMISIICFKYNGADIGRVPLKMC